MNKTQLEKDNLVTKGSIMPKDSDFEYDLGITNFDAINKYFNSGNFESDRLFIVGNHGGVSLNPAAETPAKDECKFFLITINKSMEITLLKKITINSIWMILVRRAQM